MVLGGSKMFPLCCQQLTGDESWVLVAIENIKQQCLVTVQFDITFWIPDTNNVPALPPVVNTICPNDCSGNGRCVQGECLSASMPACLSACAPICTPACLPVCLPIHISVCRHTCLGFSEHLCVCFPSN